MTQKPISPENFDHAISKPQSKIIWTIDGIAGRIGRGPKFVIQHLLDAPGSPIKKIGGRYCAVEDELLDFFRP